MKSSVIHTTRNNKSNLSDSWKMNISMNIEEYGIDKKFLIYKSFE